MSIFKEKLLTKISELNKNSEYILFRKLVKGFISKDINIVVRALYYIDKGNDNYKLCLSDKVEHEKGCSGYDISDDAFKYLRKYKDFIGIYNLDYKNKYYHIGKYRAWRFTINKNFGIYKEYKSIMTKYLLSETFIKWKKEFETLLLSDILLKKFRMFYNEYNEYYTYDCDCELYLYISDSTNMYAYLYMDNKILNTVPFKDKDNNYWLDFNKNFLQ